MKSIDRLEELDKIRNKEGFRFFINEIRIESVNEKSNDMLKLIEKAIEICKMIKDKKTLVNLYDLKIRQIYTNKEKLIEIDRLIKLIQTLSSDINYEGGYILGYYWTWYIEKFRGNKKESSNALVKTMRLIQKSSEIDDFIYFSCKYSYSVEKWLEEHDPSSAEILEECIDYFFKNGLYRSLIQSLGILLVIYQNSQNKKKILQISEMLFSDKYLFNQQTKDVQAIAYYFAGTGKLLEYNLFQAEILFDESFQLFDKILEQSNYYNYYFVRLLSHMATVNALQGKSERALELIDKIGKLLENKKIINNLDDYSKRQIPHALNITKFYLYTRTSGFNNEIVEKLTREIYTGIKNNYSDSIMLSEFLLNMELDSTQLKELKSTENSSLKRVGHIIDYLIEKTEGKFTKQEEMFTKLMLILNDRSYTKKLTLTEKAFFDILVAQELYFFNNFTEIHQLLIKYKRQLNRINILEMRIFLEAFIQVGKFCNGDPLAPALHFMAIKQSRKFKFGRLEKILLGQQNKMRNIAQTSMKT